MKTEELKPTAKLSIKKSVLKQYVVDGEKAYFLKDGTNFEIELFNPLSETILAKISYNKKNGKTWDGIVLRPGQRVFLERHIDTDKKLKFITYEIEDTPAAKENGLVTVSFYKEMIWQNPAWYDGTSITITPTYSDPFYYTTGETAYTTNSGTSEPIETKGTKSNQNLVDTYEQFHSYAFLKEAFRILPDSLKIKDIKHKHYCSRCGNKVKHDDNFCANCGKELD